MKDNILETFLSLMKIRHTKAYTRQHFTEHPHKYNLYGLSSMLFDYGVENSGLKIINKTDIHLIECPLIAHIGDDFVIVEKINKSNIHFIQGDKKITISLEDFNKMWTGYVLIAESTNLSIEPNYVAHKKMELFFKTQKILLILSVIFLLIYSTTSFQNYLSIGTALLFLANIIGLFIGYLLILKQLSIQSNYADKLCSLFKHSDCNNVLESEAAKFLGFLGWSEVGFGYFIANILILSFLPDLINYLAIINIVALPYTFWSVWYQKHKAKQWCALCLLSLLLLWSIFTINVIFGYFNFPRFDFFNLLAVGGIYLIAILGLNMLIPIIAKSNNASNIQYEISSITADENVFKTLLTKQPHYEVSKNTSQLLFGNTGSQNLITIFSNPHCNPCAKMHKRVNDLISHNKDVCVQYILSSFNEDLDVSNKYLIGVYQQKNGEAMQLFDNWFEFGKYNKEHFFERFPIEMGQKDIEKEFTQHAQWKEESGLRSTPTILVNGYKLPDNYKIEDLRFLSNIEI